MSRNVRQLLLVDRHFDDVDDLTETARFWDLDFRQLDRGLFQGSVFQATLGQMLITEARFGRSLQQEGCTPSGMRTFAFPASEQINMNWRRLDVGANDLLIFPANGEVSSISRSNFHVFTVSLPESELELAADVLGVSGIQNLLSHEIVPSLSLVPILRSKLRQAVDSWAQHCAADVARLQLDVAMLIVRTLQEGTSSDRSTGHRLRDRALLRAESFIARLEREAFNVGELCKFAGVSERTLRNAFNAHFGVSPKAYLMARRLNGVRRDLKRLAEEGASINEIAAHWGFWHMGQFAADFQRHFGELPSEAIRCNRSGRRGH